MTGAAITQLLFRIDDFIPPPASRLPPPASSLYNRKRPLQRRHRHVVVLACVGRLRLDIDNDSIGKLNAINDHPAREPSIDYSPTPRKYANPFRHLDPVRSHDDECIFNFGRRIFRPSDCQLALHSSDRYLSSRSLVHGGDAWAPPPA